MTTASTPIIQADHLTVQYGAGREIALEDVSVTLNVGERVALIGPNGAGKSTFIKAVMGMLPPSSGSITVSEDPLRIGYVPQSDDVKWDFPVTVRDVVLMGCTRQIGWLRLPGKVHQRTVDDAIEQVGLHLLGDVPIGDLSGGQRRRVFIARALAQKARLLILDEPFSGVDVSAQGDLMQVLDRLNADGITILLSTHDLDLAYRHFDKVMAIRRRLIAYGDPKDVFCSETLAQLYGARVVAYHSDGHPMTMYVDDHHCSEC